MDLRNSVNINENLCRLARFGANITDAYGCYIFLPESHMKVGDASIRNISQNLFLAGFHSLSNEVIRDCRLEPGNGLIGWVAKHKRSIHVSPFERDSRTLGFYFEDQKLKSFIGIPVFIDSSVAQPNGVAGVIACDSKKSFAFSKIQGKLLEELACEITHQLTLSQIILENGLHKQSWQRFMQKAVQLSDSLGKESIEILRTSIKNFYQVESCVGTAKATSLADMTLRLVEQALPPHFPSFRLPNGDMIMIVDNMMTSFLENKIRAVCQHCGSVSSGSDKGGIGQFEIEFTRRSPRSKKYRGYDIEKLINATCLTEESEGGVRILDKVYEYKRA